MRCTFLSLAVAVVLVCASSANAALTPVLSYDAATGIGGAGEVTDSSGAGNDGATSGAGVTTVAGGPGGAGDTSYSFDSSADKINSNATQLLLNADVFAAGGFTMDVWFNLDGNDPNSSGKLIDYAGTEGLQFDADDNVVFVMNSSATTRIASSVSVFDSAWHHVTGEFVVTGGTAAEPVGDMRITVDGTTDIFAAQALTDFGDSLNRTIGIGQHPNFSGAVDNYDGLMFNPTVSLGVVIPEPSTLVLAGLGLVGLVGVVRRRK